MTKGVEAGDYASERELLDKLRARYEALGYEFVVQPRPSELPDFIDGYIPDAIAIRGDQRIAIEVRRNSSDPSHSLASIARKFQSKPGWRFTVTFGTDDPLLSTDMPTEQIDAIRSEIGRIRKMLDDGYQDAALVMAFALLEATARVTHESKDSRPLTPGTVVQMLAMEGLIAPDLAARLRELVSRRNQIVHGGTIAATTESDVGEVLTAVEAALTSAFAG